MDKQELSKLVLAQYKEDGLWGETYSAMQLPGELERGEDAHLSFLTLVFTISGGRKPEQLWQAARDTFQDDPELFDPKFLAYAKPKDFLPRLIVHPLLKMAKSEATIWQRIGQALVMRAGGSVKKLLEDNDFYAAQMMDMLHKSKTTFPVLSGKQTAPRWLYGLVAAGGQKIEGADQLAVPISPAIKRVFERLSIEGENISTPMFDPFDALGRKGCAQMRKNIVACPVREDCPASTNCKYGQDA